MTGPELRSRCVAWFDDWRRRVNLLAAPLEILRIKPGPLFRLIASLIAVGLDIAVIEMVDSGSCNGVGVCG